MKGETKFCLQLLIQIFLFFQFGNGQVTAVFQPGPAAGKDATVIDRVGYTTTNYGNYQDIIGNAWTNSGDDLVQRSFIEFDLTSIPSSAVVTLAELSLYFNPSTGNFQQHSGLNSCYLEQVSSSWNENSITWANQPSTITTNQVTLNQSSSATQDYSNINVTPMVQNMVSNPATNYGLMMKLQTETKYRTLVFGSSDAPDSTNWPKLTVIYDTTGFPVVADSCVILRPDWEIGKDAVVLNRPGYENTNYGVHPDFICNAWVNGGDDVFQRSLLEFDLSFIPSNSSIVSAELSLYSNPLSGNTQLHSGANSSYLQRITSTWNEGTVTWNNQPTTTTANQVTLAQSVSQTDNYPKIPVTALVQDMVNNPSSSFGFMLRLQTEVKMRTLVFAASDHPDTSLHPKLEICYDFPVGNFENEMTKESHNYFSLVPNPANGSFAVYFTSRAASNGEIEVMGLDGKVVLRKEFQAGNGISEFENSPSLNPGIYFVIVTMNNSVSTKKLVVIK